MTGFAPTIGDAEGQRPHIVIERARPVGFFGTFDWHRVHVHAYRHGRSESNSIAFPYVPSECDLSADPAIKCGSRSFPNHGLHGTAYPHAATRGLNMTGTGTVWAGPGTGHRRRLLPLPAGPDVLHRRRLEARRRADAGGCVQDGHQRAGLATRHRHDMGNRERHDRPGCPHRPLTDRIRSHSPASSPVDGCRRRMTIRNCPYRAACWACRSSFPSACSLWRYR